MDSFSIALIILLVLMFITILFLIYRTFKLGIQLNDTKETIAYSQRILVADPHEKGLIGEKICATILSKLPKNLWKTQCMVEGGTVDFALFIPLSDEKELVIPIDAKTIAPKKIAANLLAGKSLDDAEKKELRSIAINRMKQLRKYINPEKGTTDFALMFTQDLIYSLLDYETLEEFHRNRVIPINPSGLMVTIFWVHKLYTSHQLSKGFDEFVESFNNWRRDFSDFVEILEKNANSAKSYAKKAEENHGQAQQLLENLHLIVKRRIDS